MLTLSQEYASRIEVVDTNVGKAIRATQRIPKGTHLYPFAGKILNAPNMHTVQLDATRHILCVGQCTPTPPTILPHPLTLNFRPSPLLCDRRP